MKIIQRLLAVLGAMIVLASIATPAIGAPEPATAPQQLQTTQVQMSPDQGRIICEGSAGGQNSDGMWAPLLPIERWKDATTVFHSRLGGAAWDHLDKKVQRGSLMGLSMSWGNMMWSSSLAMVSASTQFCAMDELGGFADGLAGKFGQMFTQTPWGGAIAAFLIITTFFVLMFRAARTGSGSEVAKGMVARALLLGIIVVMTAGATASTGKGTGNGDGAYTPGSLSPGWFAVNANKAINGLGSMGVSMFNDLGLNSLDAPQGNWRNDQLSCQRFVNNMKTAYKQSYGPTPPEQMGAGMPIMLSEMWEATGLDAWRKAQFGTSLDGGYYGMPERAYCSLLEIQANARVQAGEEDMTRMTTGTRRALWLGEGDTRSPAWESLGQNWNRQVFNPPDGEKGRDQNTVMTAACELKGSSVEDESSWGVSTFFNKDNAGDRELKPSDCANWFKDKDRMPDASDWGNADDKTKDKFEGTRGFILTLHGMDNSAGISSSMAFSVSGTINWVIFAGISIGLLVMKLIVVLMVAFVIILLIAGLFPNSDTSKVIKGIRTTFGLMVLTMFASILFGVIGMMTQLMNKAGAGIFGTGSAGVMWFSAFTPFIAVLVLHFLFTKVMHLPSPFTVKGAMGWMANASSISSAVGSVRSGGGDSAPGSRLLKKGAGKAKNNLKTKGENARRRFGNAPIPGGADDKHPEDAKNQSKKDSKSKKQLTPEQQRVQALRDQREADKDAAEMAQEQREAKKHEEAEAKKQGLSKKELRDRQRGEFQEAREVAKQKNAEEKAMAPSLRDRMRAANNTNGALGAAGVAASTMKKPVSMGMKAGKYGALLGVGAVTLGVPGIAIATGAAAVKGIQAYRNRSINAQARDMVNQRAVEQWKRATAPKTPRHAANGEKPVTPPTSTAVAPPPTAAEAKAEQQVSQQEANPPNAEP